MAGKKSPLHRLREIREEDRRDAAKMAARETERNRIINEAAQQGFTQEQVALAIGLSQSRIQELITGDR